MNSKTIIQTCENFFKNFCTHRLNKVSQVNSRYFEQFRNLTSLWDSKNINDQDSLELSEAWNSVLYCYKVVLEKLSIEIITSKKVSKDENNQTNFEDKLPLIPIIQLNNSLSTETPLITPFLIDLLETVKELTSTCENMKSYLESNTGLTNSSSTNSLSIVLLLVKIICNKIETSNHDLLEKIFGSILYCLNILFRIYKIEFTENWDLILYPEKSSSFSLELNSLLNNEISIILNIESDLPFLSYFLFSSKTKMRVNSILCIQSIFIAPIFKFNSMVSLLSRPFSQQILDTSASSLSKNVAILVLSLLKFGEHIFKSKSYDLDTGITFIKTISKIVSTTPTLFWIKNSINNVRFINMLSEILFFSLIDSSLFIPSLQLFSNILILIKNCEISKSIIMIDLNPCFEQVLINSCIVLNIPKGLNNEKINVKNASSKVRVILVEVLNFYIKLLENFPLLLLSINSNPSLLINNKLGIKDYLTTFVNILEFINFNPGGLDQFTYEKSLKATYLLINCFKELRITKLKRKNCLENQFQHLDSDFFQSIQEPEFTNINAEVQYLKIFEFLKSFIIFTFNFVIENLVISKGEPTNSNELQINKNSICRILDLYSTINPIFLEVTSYNSLSKVINEVKRNNKESLFKSEEIKEFILKNSKISFVELLLLILNKTEDRVLPSLINVLLSYCGNSEWIKYTSFTTFQHFESCLVQKLLFLISFDNSLNMKSIKESTILSVNKAVLYINAYHNINTSKVIFCSSNYRKTNINLIEENYDKFIDNCEIEFNEICCLLNWREIFFSYKQLIQYFECNSNFSKSSNSSNLSESVRAFGRILRLVPFNSNDLEDISWALDLLNNYISNTISNTFRHNKVKWNSIYAIGLLFENDNFCNLIIQSFYKANKSKNLSITFSKSWKVLCLIIVNNSELTKVRISALRSLTGFSGLNSESDPKIPFKLLFDAWESFKMVVDTTLLDISTSINKVQTANSEYPLLWSTYLNKLGQLLYKNSMFYLRNPTNNLYTLEAEKISRYCSKFFEKGKIS